MSIERSVYFSNIRQMWAYEKPEITLSTSVRLVRQYYPTELEATEAMLADAPGTQSAPEEKEFE